MLYPTETSSENDGYPSQAYATDTYNVSVFNDSLPNNTPQKFICEFESTSEDLLGQTIFKICICLLYGAVFLVALLGNGLVCFVVHTTPRMKTVTNYFMVNLAVGDILMTVFCVPFSSVSTLVLQYWPFGAAMCRIVNYSQAVSVLVSAYTLLAISIDRYLVIMRPLKPRVEKGAAKLVVAAVWAGALVTAAPIPVVSHLQKPSDWHVVCDVDVCGEQWLSTDQSVRYTYALFALQFALPLSALVCTYARIAHVVWGGRPPGEAHYARDSRMARSKRKMIKMMVTVVVVFTICWLPLNAFMVLWAAHEQDDEWNRWPGMQYVWFASHWLAMSHSCYNPIIYCYMNARYRFGFKQVLGGLFCSRNMNSARSCQQRSSICEGIPLSEKVPVNGSMVSRRSVLGCRCPQPCGNEAGACAHCTSLRQLELIGPSVAALPARALSFRLDFS